MPKVDERLAPYLANPCLLTSSDPLRFIGANWPELRLYDKQVEIIESVRDNDETIVPAGNDLGKDFIAGLTALWFFCSRSPVRVLTTSVDGSQLEGVLWGEIRRFIQTSKNRLPILVNHLHIRQLLNGLIEPRSELIGRVVKKGEGLLGRHIERGKNDLPTTLCVYDEASALDDVCYETSDTWTHRKLIIGNPYPCENFFKRFTEAGDLPRDNGVGFIRKIIRITAEDSPNVRLARTQLRVNREPTNESLIPGVLDYRTYLNRRKLWDPKRQSIGLDARFYRGKEVMLYPDEWLDLASTYALSLRLRRRRARTMGVDAAEGGDSTVWTVIDALGIIYQLSMKTSDTSDIPGRTIALIKQYGILPSNVLFDRGGGGKEHADYLRKIGYAVRTIGFGEPATDATLDKYTLKDQKELVETKYTYKNRRAEMYGMLRILLNPGEDNEPRFAIPKEYTELIRQLRLMPLLYDSEGRLYLPPKDKKSPESKDITLRIILGRSPDEADSLVLAVFGLKDPNTPSAGAIDLGDNPLDAASPDSYYWDYR